MKAACIAVFLCVFASLREMKRRRDAETQRKANEIRNNISFVRQVKAQ